MDWVLYYNGLRHERVKSKRRQNVEGNIFLETTIKIFENFQNNFQREKVVYLKTTELQNLTFSIIITYNNTIIA